MKENYLLNSLVAEKIYSKIKDLPIIDYHCHLSPKEIFEDKQFENLGKIWLSGDHYKWRLMRSSGIDEEYITGNSSFDEKFNSFAKAIEFAGGNPLYHWSHMELSKYFGIEDNLKSSTAKAIYKRANAKILEEGISPRKLIESSNVEVICTTDDIIDDLGYHKKIREDKTFKTKVLPSFRTDNLLLIKRDGYKDYILKLSQVSGVKVDDLNSLKESVEKRLVFFVENGCKFTDVGIPYFPNGIAKDKDADKTFKKALSGKKITEKEYLLFLGNMYLFLGKLYKKYDLSMQLHLNVYRNANTTLFNQIGADCGVDTVGDNVSGSSIIKMLDAINLDGGLPKTIIYTLNPSCTEQIASISYAFNKVKCGAAWWFCDHKRGIKEEIEIIAENSSIGSFLGMLTDSRSFLSYARHDYFRRILCSIIAEWIDSGEYDEESGIKLASKICYENIKEYMGE